MTEPLDDAREEIARIIYEAFPFDGAGQKPEWTPGGNSLRQDEARDAADKIIARAAPARCDAESDLASFIPITGPGVDALENRKESDNGPSEEQVNADLRRSLVPPPSGAGREELREALDHMHGARLSSIHAKTEVAHLRNVIQDTIEALERNSTSAPVVECLKAALSPDPETVAVASAQYRCTCGAEPYCAPNVHAASCPLAVTSTDR